ncbi:terpenoid synthase [Hypoxylon sp. EC38]|nr:terpenoid synthase [Hypoxylon sp. EC38]
MAYDYALVHLKYTIPLASLLTFILAPLLTRLDLYEALTLILVAFFATLPWDSYLIRHGIWTYPPDAIAGPRLLGVPAEELFFFIIQTYITSMLYILLNKPVLHAKFLTNNEDSSPKSQRISTLGQALLIGCIIVGASLVGKGFKGTYLGLILIWACPFALLTWSFSGSFLIGLPFVCIATPIIVPTVYLWVVDELALGRGTWAIESGTKLGWRLWGSLELEEAIFFLGIREAIEILRRKSRSFYLASSVFPGRLRIDLVLLYSFCRVADDLIDDSRTESEALTWIKKLTDYLNLVYGSDDQLPSPTHIINDFIWKKFPRETCTVGELCLWLVFHHCETKLPSDKETILVIAAQTMGHALQYVNIARDILIDAEMGRVYLPTNWLKEEDLTPQDIIKDPKQPRVEKLRQKLLDYAFKEYERSRPVMNMLPGQVRGPLIVAVESYMEIGRVLRERIGVPSQTRRGRATVPRLRRLWVAWKNLWSER